MEENKNTEQEICEIPEVEDLNSESTYFTEPIILDEQLYSKSLDFEEGSKIAMKYAGMYSTFVGNGMSAEDSLVLILNIINSNMNIKLAEINKDATIESVKVKNDIDESGRL